MKQLINTLLTELPEPYRSKALNLRHRKDMCHPTTMYAENVAQAVLKGFTWNGDPRFWSEVYEKVRIGGVEALPVPKSEPKKSELSPNAQSVLKSLRRRQFLRTSSYGRGILRKSIRELRMAGYEIDEVKGRQFRHGKKWKTEDVFFLR